MPVLPFPAGTWPALTRRRRTAAIVLAVVAAHVVLVVLMLTRHDDTVAVPVLQSQTLTAELLPRTPAAPAAIQSAPTPVPPKPIPQHVARAKPRAPARASPAPTPLPVADTPSPPPAEAPAPLAPAAPSAPEQAAPSAPPRPTLALSAPQNVSHLDCRIVLPDYPSISRDEGETGVVYVHFVVGTTGIIEDIALQRSSGYRRLDAAALDAMRASTCKPYLENGQPVRAAYTQPFDFNLSN
ncbi:energy transducer TonB [Burkholderia sp. WAC0059]|uniref:energy transducer TonB n=1 Tax=Burkholderia sp. WAC0059 TaxID=2066022 RepID=UPI000C7F0789|nr:energy transducer TonB [Burkholderia sp. WAC0059]PLZ03009.1 energy transducer TonB [Burkholderia sp. WAC0059]